MKIKHVYIFANGMVCVFDENDHQVPRLQGVIFEVMKKIGKEADEDTMFKIHAWSFKEPVAKSRTMNIKWWFKKHKKEKVTLRKLWNRIVIHKIFKQTDTIAKVFCPFYPCDRPSEGNCAECLEVKKNHYPNK